MRRAVKTSRSRALQGYCRHEGKAIPTMAAASTKRRLSLLQLVVIPMASCLAFAGHLPSSSLPVRGSLSMVRGSASYGIGGACAAAGGVSSTPGLPRSGSFFLPTRRTQSRLHASRADEQVHFCGGICV